MSSPWRNFGETPAALLRRVPRPLPRAAARRHRALPGRLPARPRCPSPGPPQYVRHAASCECAEHSAPTQVHIGAIKSPDRDSHLTHMPAKDWEPLRRALWQHVRKPLAANFAQEWAQVERRGIIEFDPLNALAKGGMISATDDRWTALWYALVYACPHFDALTALMQERVFRERVMQELEREQQTRTHEDANHHILSRFLRCRYFSPRVLHIDFGCGPGTASWAVINMLSGRAALTTIGHDHNQQMIGLASSITSDVAKSQRNVTYRFYSNWNKFAKKSIYLASRSWNAVIVTANSIFGQPSLDDEAINAIVSVIADIQRHARVSLFLTLGTHPPIYEDKVAGAWQRIARIANSDVLHEGNVGFDSWNPIRPGGFQQDDENAWFVWRGRPQLAHVIEMRAR